MTENENPPNTKGLSIFGVDFSKIECFREALLTGYPTAVVGGLAGFFYTSKIRLACHIAFGSFWLGAYTNWFWCRYNKYKREKDMENLKALMVPEEMKEDEYNLPHHLKSSNDSTVSEDNVPFNKR